MGLADKNGSLPQFDKVIRTYQGETLLSMIFASHWEWLKNSGDEESRKKGLEIRLKPIYDIFKINGAGTYGNDESKISAQFSRQYTIGHDMGIWTGKDLMLSDYAKEVARNRVPIVDYITRSFLNLFTYIDNQYVHILYDICDYVDSISKIEVNSDDIIRALGIEGSNIPDQEEKEKFQKAAKEQARLILNYLSSTYFFEVVKGVQGDADIITFASNYKAEKVKELCNLEYKDKNGEETRKFFSNKVNYANYIAKYPKNYDSLPAQEMVKEEKEKTYKIKDRLNIDCKLRTETIQKIIYGPPGIGKSYSITNEVKQSYSDFKLEDDNPFVLRTTLHPEYTYNDFVGQIMPVVKEKDITYDFTPGIFTQALDRAIEYEKNDVYLILEEMSRANVAAIFGDIFQLLDRKNGISEYRVNHDLIAKEIYGDVERKIYLPKNLHIIGTVNTSDQNVYVMDTAFKRRFDFEYMSLKPIIKEGEFLNSYSMDFENSSKEIISSDWVEFYQTLNRYIVKELKLSEDKQVGQFFIQFSENQERNNKAISNKLLQYLWQDIHLSSFSNQSLFRLNVKTFSDAYEELENNLMTNQPITIFSDDFLGELENFRNGSK